jgi:hypothetical protein
MCMLAGTPYPPDRRPGGLEHVHGDVLAADPCSVNSRNANSALFVGGLADKLVLFKTTGFQKTLKILVASQVRLEQPKTRGAMSLSSSWQAVVIQWRHEYLLTCAESGLWANVSGCQV